MHFPKTEQPQHRSAGSPARAFPCSARSQSVSLSASLATLLASLTLSSSAATSSRDNSSLTAGGRQMSANYTNDGSLGGISGSASLSTATARHGFAGQLMDVQSVAVSASPTTVNEGAPRQLNAVAVLDDATFLALVTTNVAWSVVSGAVSSVNASGLATAAIVYQDSPAIVRGDYRSKSGTLALTVLNVNNDDFGTYAGDGIDDAWQVQYFGVNNPSGAATADPDGDGQNNLFEYLAGTVPTNNASFFSFTLSAPAATQRNLSFSPITAGRTYTVEFRTNLTTGTFSTLTGATQSDNGSTRTVSDVNATNSFCCYRVRISLP